MSKCLIINADDFGFTRDVNAGIVHAHRHGILTSTTLMANGEAFDDAVKLACATPSLDVGCHLVLVQGNSVLDGRAFPETLPQCYAALATGRIDPYRELRAQIEKLQQAGIHPTHLDSHKHTHIVPSVFRAAVRLAHEFGIAYVRLPLDATMKFLQPGCSFASRFYRRFAEKVSVRVTDHFLGYRLTGYLTEESLAQVVGHLPEGTTELMCHPGFLGPDLRNAPTRLKEARLRELEALTSPRIRELLARHGISLGTFSRNNPEERYYASST